MTQQLRVVFAGTPDNSAETLERLHLAGIQLVGVLTRRDSRVGRSGELSSTPVAQKALQLGLATHKSNSMDEPTLKWLSALNADLGVVVGYGTIFRKNVLAIPRLGWLNLHYSLLPELPGPAPVQHAIMQGKKFTGVTVFRLDEGVDTGPIVSSKQIAIHELDTAGLLLARLTGVGSDLLTDVLVAGEPLIAAAVAQQGVGDFPIASKPTRAQAKLDFTTDASTQLNKIRAMNPEPMAWFEYKSAPVRVLQASLLSSTSSESSQATMVSKQVIVSCQAGSLILDVVQPAGKNTMSGADWFRGLRAENLKLS